MDSSHDFLVNQSMASFGSEPTVSSSSKYYIKLPRVRYIRDKQPLDTWKCHIFYLLGTTLVVDKLTAYTHIHTYTCGTVTLVHLYRSLCHASWYDCKEIEVSINLLFVWEWDRMSWYAPILKYRDMIEAGYMPDG
ncbi:hypothetical protein Ahy_A10g048371 [Arachis hypogaea]|uniref:Aminotransferase-like plant mobile domain-containing protein n=1 Tax=Arachis hypogaea TaxID=3818 RepID=A0A445B4Z0_ARAHY|nr:hypothetical protein Ahy_A10g048371 [Arachis hypogaea]